MWYIRMMALMAAVFVFLWFMVMNKDQSVLIRLPGRELNDVPLVFALLVTFVAGMFVWFVVSMFQDLRLRNELRRARKDAARLRDELTSLRNLPVDDFDDTGDVVEPEELTQ